MTAFAVVVLLLSSQAAWGAASLSGRVATRDGSRTEPVPDAYVQAKAGNPQRVVAQAETDSRGRFALQDLPAGRVTFAVEAAGYYTIKAGTLDTETITRTCPEAGDCGQVDFVVAKAAVLEGWLADNFGEPVESASVSLTPASGDEGPPPQGRPVRHTAHHAMSDDRGYFRIWDIKPGRYKLVANRPPMWGPPLPLEEREIEVTGGDGPQEVRLEMKGEAEVFSVSGMIEGLTEEDLKRTTLGIQPMLPANSEGSRLWTMFTMIREGKFSFGGLKKGEYIAHLVGGQGGQRTMRLMGVLDVDQDLADLRLEPMEPTGVRGRVRFVDGEPRNLSLGAVPNGSWCLSTGAGLYAQLGVEGPDYTGPSRPSARTYGADGRAWPGAVRGRRTKKPVPRGRSERNRGGAICPTWC